MNGFTFPLKVEIKSVGIIASWNIYCKNAKIGIKITDTKSNFLDLANSFSIGVWWTIIDRKTITITKIGNEKILNSFVNENPAPMNAKSSIAPASDNEMKTISTVP
ncbi:hypothetical protein J7894_01150 [Mycoplasmopsis agalactiae]|nr:hypothetical protein [Mycoplasmopsis agalactiae]MCE6090694.1 hypothetical protein [Mycoplasmopsis agalactiae]